MDRFTTGDFIGLSVFKPEPVEIVGGLLVTCALQFTLGLRLAMNESVFSSLLVTQSPGSSLPHPSKIDNVAHRYRPACAGYERTPGGPFGCPIPAIDCANSMALERRNLAAHKIAVGV
jgi:hypothetical protein